MSSMNAVKELLATAEMAESGVNHRVIEQLRQIRLLAGDLFEARNSTQLALSERDFEAGIERLRGEQSRVLQEAGLQDPNCIELLYPKLDVKFLELVRPDGLPRLIPFTLNNRTSSLTIKLNSSGFYELEMSDAFRLVGVSSSLYYREGRLVKDLVLNAMKQVEVKDKNRFPLPSSECFKFELRGVIPSEVRALTMAAQFDFNKILVLTEMGSEPKAKLTYAPVDKAQVIVGLDNWARMYLVADFYTKGYESLFATTPPGMAQLRS